MPYKLRTLIMFSLQVCVVTAILICLVQESYGQSASSKQLTRNNLIVSLFNSFSIENEQAFLNLIKINNIKIVDKNHFDTSIIYLHNNSGKLEFIRKTYTHLNENESKCHFLYSDITDNHSTTYYAVIISILSDENFNVSVKIDIKKLPKMIEGDTTILDDFISTNRDNYVEKRK